MISLLQLLNEIIGFDESYLNESTTGEEAKRLGLTYMKFGRYGKDGVVTHKSVGGKLQPVKGGDSDGPTKAPTKAITKTPTATKGKVSTPSAPTQKITSKIVTQYKDSKKRGQTATAAEMLANLFGTPAEQRQVQAAKKHRQTSPYSGTTVKSKKYNALVDAIIKKYEPRLGLEPEKPRDPNALTPKNRNTKTDTKAVKKHLTTRYQKVLRTQGIDIIDERDGLVLLGTPTFRDNETDWLAIGQQKDGQWAIREVDYLDKNGNPVFVKSDSNFSQAESLDALMQDYFDAKPSKEPEKPTKNDNYRTPITGRQSKGRN